MDVRMLQRHARLEQQAEELLKQSQERGLLSARGQHRVLRVARTIADLNGSERVRARDVGSALAMRSEAEHAGSRAA
jgi:magnesium chelatase family protein